MPVCSRKSGVVEDIWVSSEHVPESRTQLRKPCLALFLLLDAQPLVYLYANPINIPILSRDMQTYLLPASFLLRERVKGLIKRICDDSAHRLIPRPVRINACFTQQVHERLLALLDGQEPVVRDDRGRLADSAAPAARCLRRAGGRPCARRRQGLRHWAGRTEERTRMRTGLHLPGGRFHLVLLLSRE